MSEKMHTTQDKTHAAQNNRPSFRLIAHADCNNFFASVELLKYPDLQDRPVAVAGDPKARHGIILAKNSIAKRFRIKTAEPISSAKAKCPELVLLPPHMKEYAEMSERINRIYRRYSNEVESFSIDESFIDLTDLSHGDRKAALDLAQMIRSEVYEETGIEVSVGLSETKGIAKIASDLAKASGIFELWNFELQKKLWPLSIDHLIFVGRSTNQRLQRLGIRSIADFVHSDATLIETVLGKAGIYLRAQALGQGDDHVRGEHEQREAKSMGHARTFREDVLSQTRLNFEVDRLCEEVDQRLTKAKRYFSVLRVLVRNHQFEERSKQMQFREPLRDLGTMRKEARRMASELQAGEALRLISITADKLCEEEDQKQQIQLSFFEENLSVPKMREKRRSSPAKNQGDESSEKQLEAEDLLLLSQKKEKRNNLMRCFEQIREKYGQGTLDFASGLKKSKPK